MRNFIFIVIGFILISCNEQEKQDDTRDPINLAEINFASTKMVLVGDAKAAASDWVEYTRLETALENYDHSVSATEQMASITSDMRTSIPLELNNQPIRSRLLVLQTKIKVYQSFLQHSSKTAAEHQQLYNAVTLALDNFIGQLNEVYIRDLQMKELIDELKGELPDSDVVETDSLS
ncbi:hypothetical protein [Nonlabens antarcticus]|uniref:hypothetical protein n=1 Tax=Nonlabens antarcticus TaxID=392714 RepID=UPI001890DE71|nr:hypothetical protein [Nonlabens antarcticus]